MDTVFHGVTQQRERQYRRVLDLWIAINGVAVFQLVASAGAAAVYNMRVKGLCCSAACRRYRIAILVLDDQRWQIREVRQTECWTRRCVPSIRHISLHYSRIVARRALPAALGPKPARI